MARQSEQVLIYMHARPGSYEIADMALGFGPTLRTENKTTKRNRRAS